MRIEARTLTEQRNILEESERLTKHEVESTMRELNTCKHKLSEAELQLESLLENVKELEEQKSQLQKSLLHLNEKLKANESNTRAEVGGGTENEQEQQYNYQQQITNLQADIVSKEHLIGQLQE